MKNAVFQQLTNLPENVFPTSDLMVEYVLEFKVQTGNGTGFSEIREVEDLVSWYQMAKDYFKSIPNATNKLLSVDGVELDRYNK